MRMLLSGNNARVEMTTAEAIVLIGKLAYTIDNASKLGQGISSQAMPMNIEEASHDLPGVVDFVVSKGKI